MWLYPQKPVKHPIVAFKLKQDAFFLKADNSLRSLTSLRAVRDDGSLLGHQGVKRRVLP